MTTPLVDAGALAKLNALFDEVGLPAGKRAEVLEGIREEVLANIARHEQEQKSGFDALRTKAAEEREMLSHMREVLGLGETESPPPKDTTPLIPQCEQLAEAIKAASATVQQRQAQRADMEAKTAEMRAELDGGDPPGPAAVDPTTDQAGGLSLALLGRRQAQLDSVRDEKDARIKQISAVRVEVTELQVVLGYTVDGANASITSEALAAAQAQLSALESERKKRAMVLVNVRDYISQLRSELQTQMSEWAELPNPESKGLTPEVLKAYNDEIKLPDPQTKGLTPEVLKPYHDEIERLEGIKAARIAAEDSSKCIYIYFNRPVHQQG